MASSNKSETNANSNVLFEKKPIKIPTRVAGKEYQRSAKKKTEEKKSDKIENTFTSSTFPIIVIAIIGVFLLVFLFKLFLPLDILPHSLHLNNSYLLTDVK